MSKNEFTCDCNVIHQDVVENTIKSLPDADTFNKLAEFFQLWTLRRIGILKCRKTGKEVLYMLDDNHVKQVFEIGAEHIEHKKGK